MNESVPAAEAERDPSGPGRASEATSCGHALALSVPTTTTPTIDQVKIPRRIDRRTVRARGHSHDGPPFIGEFMTLSVSLAAKIG